MNMAAPELSLMKKREENRSRVDPLAKRTTFEQTENPSENVDSNKQKPRSRGSSFIVQNIKNNHAIEHTGGFNAATVDSLVHTAIKEKRTPRQIP